jgi:hypothetical protein
MFFRDSDRSVADAATALADPDLHAFFLVFHSFSSFLAYWPIIILMVKNFYEFLFNVIDPKESLEK